MNRTLATLAAIICLQGAASLALAEKTPYEDALHVYGCADYPKAFKLFVPLAEQGDRLAQFQVGMMTEQGQGTDADLKIAYDWYLKAAQQGVADAYFALGQIYSRGEVVAKDPVQAYAWFDLAKKAGHAVAGDWLKMEAKRVKPDDLPKAQDLVTQWLEKIAKR
jgi:TPR repeat protein